MSVRIEENADFADKVENWKSVIFPPLVGNSEVISVVQFVCSDLPRMSENYHKTFPLARDQNIVTRGSNSGVSFSCKRTSNFPGELRGCYSGLGLCLARR